MEKKKKKRKNSRDYIYKNKPRLTSSHRHPFPPMWRRGWAVSAGAHWPAGHRPDSSSEPSRWSAGLRVARAPLGWQREQPGDRIPPVECGWLAVQHFPLERTRVLRDPGAARMAHGPGGSHAALE